MSDDLMLRSEINFLKRENAALRQSLRDEFAKAALPEIISQTQLAGVALTPDQAMLATAIIAYRIADAMMEARKS